MAENAENDSPPAEPTTDSKGRPFISLADVAKHSEKEDVWMVLHDRVYNVTAYLDEHPGGEEVLMDRAGANATMDFEDVGHSKDARKQLEKFEVGELPPSERGGSDGDAGGGGGGGSSSMLMAVPVLLAAIGAGYYYYATQQ
uniref:Cytochrome b5 heme-binding domain-containing protein n=1 Tax=Calcidiscus leptoporus TaxID=127549 RepID=A0A7S0ISH2_9EUKA|mmetsp:Transcript_19426/g.44666  ORF Transcript_19426/g.44666 Transcript_19426/m.44666 type:complete len:142 (+) Transcript_19426:19-444(+)|eukprot:CAMPEP_0119373132 /NCGR_PEP_ID=MMETSP1334-20130426/23655_1 /TAXON_ID=127549 /ORGANISM="Calcidiscus leptoporus, Strain RCC1130" /LENGTH=141 /DNA_ID=CAMNT_0007390807 /DNA_START=24 /DNA_END=449 /DNA_ORIENTATION=-